MIPLHTAEQLARHGEAPPEGGQPDWRLVARSRFWPCRSADEVRDAYRDLWREAEGAGYADLDAINAEFGAALGRFGEGARLAREKVRA